MNRGGDVTCFQMGVERLDFVRTDLVCFDIKDMRQRCLTQNFFLAMLGQGNGNRAILAHTCCDTSFFFKTGVQIDRIFREACQVLTGPQLTNQTSRMPGCAAGQLLTLQQNNIGPAELGKVVGHRAARNATTYDDGTCLGWKGHKAHSLW